MKVVVLCPPDCKTKETMRIGRQASRLTKIAHVYQQGKSVQQARDYKMARSATYLVPRTTYHISNRCYPLPTSSIRKAYRTFSDNNRCRPSSKPRLSTTKLLRASLLSFSSGKALADNIISTSSSFSPYPISLHASSALRLASTRGRPGLQAT